MKKYQVAIVKCSERFSRTTIAVKRLIFLMTLLLILPPCLTLATASDLSKSELYAVLVGIANYRDTRLNLKLSARDAQDFYAFLQEREKLFKKSHIRLFVNEQATRENVTKAIRDDLKPAGKDDVVIIFLSGHGASDPVRTDEFYFLTYDADVENLFGSALPMNTSGLFKGIDSDRLILVSDACHSGGFSSALDKSTAKAADIFFSVFQNLQGRFGFASSRPDEKSWEDKKYGNSVFTHFVLKGLRGAACSKSSNGVITVKDFYEYVYEGTRAETKGKQNPQLYAAKGRADQTPIFRVPVYDKPLNIEALFVTQADNGEVTPLTNDSTLKSGQRIGLAFKADADCYVHVVWWDSSGNVGRLFPNPKLTEGTGEVKAGVTQWLPYKQGKHWYVLDKNEGEETIYLVASRERNPKLEELYTKLRSSGLEREFNLMGIEEYTVPDKAKQLSGQDRQRLFEKMENQIKVVGADKVIRIKFKHVAP
jgi:uncharacterized caspase-like protein